MNILFVCSANVCRSFLAEMLTRYEAEERHMEDLSIASAGLFAGSEGTLGIVVGATLRLVGLPVEFSAAVVTFPSIDAAGKTVFEIIRAGLSPAALELVGPECIELMNREEGLNLNLSPTIFLWNFTGPPPASWPKYWRWQKISAALKAVWSSDRGWAEPSGTAYSKRGTGWAR